LESLRALAPLHVAARIAVLLLVAAAANDRQGAIAFGCPFVAAFASASVVRMHFFILLLLFRMPATYDAISFSHYTRIFFPLKEKKNFF
jgi:hypothetical protein